MDNYIALAYLIIVYLMAGLLFLNRSKTWNYSLVALFAGLQAAFTVFACYRYNQTVLEFFTFDSLGIILLITLSVITIPVLIHSYIYIEKHNATPGVRAVYFAAIVTLIASIGLAYMANHIAVMWIFAELTTLSASGLIYHHRNKLALEGTWKYVFICAISITFVFIGILFLSLSLHQTGSSDLSYANLIANAGKLNPFWLRLAFLFIFTGFTAKLGLVPMYTAGIEAKDKAPAPAAALLSSVLMNMGFVGVFRTYAVVANTPIHHWANLVVFIAAFLSIFVAMVYMTKVMNIKRMFAYSGIEHMGLVMLGLAAGGVGVYAAILHIVLHTLIKPALFLQFNQVYWVFQSKSIYDVGNYFKYNKTGSMVIFLGFLSAAGMPPSGLFISEFMIFQALFQAHYILILLGVMLLLTMIIWGFGSNIFKLLFTPPISIDESKIPHISPWESLTQYVLLATSVYLAYNPPAGFVILIQDAVKLIQ